MIPAVFVKDMRGMNADDSETLWYLGCTMCKKQLVDSKCEAHGQNDGKKVYDAQVLFADPTRTLELAVWGEGLKFMLLCAQEASGELDAEGQLNNMLTGLLTEKLCLRVDFGVNKAGSGMYYDLFDISAQVTDEGAAGAFKALDADIFFPSPGRRLQLVTRNTQLIQCICCVKLCRNPRQR